MLHFTTSFPVTQAHLKVMNDVKVAGFVDAAESNLYQGVKLAISGRATGQLAKEILDMFFELLPQELAEVLPIRRSKARTGSSPSPRPDGPTAA